MATVSEDLINLRDVYTKVGGWNNDHQARIALEAAIERVIGPFWDWSPSRGWYDKKPAGQSQGPGGNQAAHRRKE